MVIHLLAVLTPLILIQIPGFSGEGRIRCSFEHVLRRLWHYKTDHGVDLVAYLILLNC